MAMASLLGLLVVVMFRTARFACPALALSRAPTEFCPSTLLRSANLYRPFLTMM